MTPKISRRQFGKVAFLAAGGALLPRSLSSIQIPDSRLGRVATTWIGLYREPDFSAPRMAQLFKDELISILATVDTDSPAHNPHWHETSDGFVHAGSVQLVRWNPQAPLTLIPEDGVLFEVSVPYTRTYEQPDPESHPLYRLYFESTAWITGQVTDSRGRAWYRINDEMLHTDYYARAEHFRWVPPEETSPLSAGVPDNQKRIVVSLGEQVTRAFEEDELVFEAAISSGIPDSEPQENGIPTITPTGRFYIDKKMPVRHMGDGNLTSDLEAYELPGVPWVSFFHETGVAFHGTYWHNDFGRPRSHGCVNMRNKDARWLYRWSTPQVSYSDRIQMGYGTRVVVE